MRIAPEDFAEALEEQLDAKIATLRQLLQEKGVTLLMFEGKPQSLEYVFTQWKIIQMKIALERLMDVAMWIDSPSLSARLH